MAVEAGRPQVTTPRSGAGRIGRSVAALALAAAALAVALGARERADEIALLRAEARALGLEGEALGRLERRLASAADAGERRIAAARALLAAAVAPATAADAARGAERLDAVATLARAALAAWPGGWEGAELAGVADALGRLARRDPSLLSGRAMWLAPLAAARRRYPASPRPGRALAAAWIEILPALEGEERARAEAAIRAAFLDADFERRAFARWLEVAGTLERAAEVLPERAETWTRLARAAAERTELDLAAAYHERSRRALAGELERGLAESQALGRRPGGDAAARAAIDELVARTPADARYVPWLERALAARPPGPPPPPLADAAGRWLRWARPLCIAVGCPLSPAALDRLIGLAGPALAPEEEAWAALAAGDAVRAEQLARRSDALWSERWVPYLLLAARLRLEAGDPAAARQTLARAHRSARVSALGQRIEAASPGSAGADGAAGGGGAAAAWQASEWTYERGVPMLTLVAARAAPALAVGLDRALARPTLLVVEWDGRALAPLALDGGGTTVRVPVAVTPGPHLVRLAPLAGEAPAVGLTILE